MSTTKMSTATTQTKSRLLARLLAIGLWALQLLLAALFLWHGLFLLVPPAEMVQLINENMGYGLRLFIGVAEVLAALGLVLPSLTRILPFLTAWAAAGLLPIMAGATVLHVVRDEGGSAVFTAVVLVLLALVALARGRFLPVAPRRRA